MAILSVLAFHAFPAAVPGGFVGVDIFFVISGYLISGIILNDLKKGAFTFSGFYVRRIRRIFPALALVLAFALVVGWWILLPFDYRQLGAHTAAGAGFVSNILLWQEAGDYFDTAAVLKPLLHLWSLGVEEQYYLIWPLLLFHLRGRVRLILWMILAVAVVSFASNIIAVTRMPGAAFYLPQSRFWELMIGSFIAYFRVYRAGTFDRFLVNMGAARVRISVLKDLAALTGSLLIAMALVVLTELYAFPGWWALLPTLGAALLISAGPGAWINRRILSHQAPVYVGLISYPLYLWHWPLLVYTRIWNGGQTSVLTRTVAIGAGVLLASLTYHFVEKKIRHVRPALFPRAPQVALAAVVAALGVYGLLALSNQSEARSASVPHLDGISVAVHDWAYIGDRTIRGNTRDTVVFFGDSHMQQYVPRIDKLMQERLSPVRTVVVKTKGGCAPIPGIERRGYGCDRFVEDGISIALQPEVVTVVIGASWPGFAFRKDYFWKGKLSGQPLDLLAGDLDPVLKNLEAALHRLVARGKRVVLVLSSPRGEPFDPTLMFERRGFQFRVRISPPMPRNQAREYSAYIDDRLKRIAANVGAETVNPMDFLCSATICPTTDPDGTPLYKDATHVRATVIRDRFSGFDQYVYMNSR